MTTIERKSVPPPQRRSAAPETEPRPRRAPRPKEAAKPAPGTAKAQPKAEPRPRTRPEAEPAERTRPAARTRPRPSSGRPRAPFVLLILCLLGGALVSLLLLNTVLARDTYTLSALEGSERQLIQQKQALTEEIAREEAPGRLALKARNQGMVQPTEPAFIDPGNGRVTGGTLRPVPSAAAAAAAAAGVIGVPGAIVPGDGIPGWTGSPSAEGGQSEPARTP